MGREKRRREWKRCAPLHPVWLLTPTCSSLDQLYSSGCKKKKKNLFYPWWFHHSTTQTFVKDMFRMPVDGKFARGSNLRDTQRDKSSTCEVVSLCSLTKLCFFTLFLISRRISLRWEKERHEYKLWLLQIPWRQQLDRHGSLKIVPLNLRVISCIRVFFKCRIKRIHKHYLKQILMIKHNPTFQQTRPRPRYGSSHFRVLTRLNECMMSALSIFAHTFTNTASVSLWVIIDIFNQRSRSSTANTQSTGLRAPTVCFSVSTCVRLITSSKLPKTVPLNWHTSILHLLGLYLDVCLVFYFWVSSTCGLDPLSDRSHGEVGAALDKHSEMTYRCDSSLVTSMAKCFQVFSV